MIEQTGLQPVHNLLAVPTNFSIIRQRSTIYKEHSSSSALFVFIQPR